MTAHSLSDKAWRRPWTHRRGRNGVLQLSWSHFWLLVGILGGMLGLVALVFLAYLSSR
jgi:hypothetical protein